MHMRTTAAHKISLHNRYRRPPDRRPPTATANCRLPTLAQGEHLRWGAIEVREAVTGDQGGWLVEDDDGVHMEFDLPDTAPIMERHVLSYDAQRISEGRADKEHNDDFLLVAHRHAGGRA